jgi:hypothetical protein
MVRMSSYNEADTGTDIMASAAANDEGGYPNFLKALLIHEPLFSSGSRPFDFTIS